MRSKRIPGWAQVLGTAAAALAFLLVYELAVYRVPLQQIFLPCSYIGVMRSSTASSWPL